MRPGFSNSHTEVERKFLPTPKLKQYLSLPDDQKRSRDSSNQQTGIGADTSHSDLLSFHFGRKDFIRDTYYDLNDRLSKKGIWVRYRSANFSPRPGLDSLLYGKSFEKVEAKVRLGGDYTNSQFQEIEGESNIAALVNMHLPGVKLGDLEVLAELETERKSWVVLHRDGYPATFDTFLGMNLRLVLDDVTEPFQTKREGVPFKHQIGELEYTTTLGSSPNTIMRSANKLARTDMREYAAGEMASILAELMSERYDLFACFPVPLGKLSAYFEWKRNQALMGFAR